MTKLHTIEGWSDRAVHKSPIGLSASDGYSCWPLDEINGLESRALTPCTATGQLCVQIRHIVDPRIH